MLKNETTTESLLLTVHPFTGLDQVGCYWSLQNSNHAKEKSSMSMLTTVSNQPLPNRALKLADQLGMASTNNEIEDQHIHKIVISTSSQSKKTSSALAEETIFLCGLLICKLKPNTVQLDHRREDIHTEANFAFPILVSNGNNTPPLAL